MMKLLHKDKSYITQCGIGLIKDIVSSQINFKKLFQVDKSQVATSKLKKLHQSQDWEKLNDTETENIQGGWPWPGSGGSGGGSSGGVGWNPGVRQNPGGG